MPHSTASSVPSMALTSTIDEARRPSKKASARIDTKSDRMAQIYVGGGSSNRKAYQDDLKSQIKNVDVLLPQKAKRP